MFNEHFLQRGLDHYAVFCKDDTGGVADSQSFTCGGETHEPHIISVRT